MDNTTDDLRALPASDLFGFGDLVAELTPATAEQVHVWLKQEQEARTHEWQRHQVLLCAARFAVKTGMNTPQPLRADASKLTMTIKQFCTKYNACKEGQEWALAECSSMQDVWDTAKPKWLIWIATRPLVLTDKESRLFAVFCARQVQHLMTDPRSLEAIDVAERHAKGEASNEELVTARSAAREAAWEASDAAVRTAGTTWTAAAWAASTAAWAAWAASASEAARGVAWAAARTATLESQVTWLRENTKPIFTL